MKPIKLLPAFIDYLWGGTKLKTDFGKKSDLDIVAESWELSTHKDGQSVVAEGPDAGLPCPNISTSTARGYWVQTPKSSITSRYL